MVLVNTPTVVNVTAMEVIRDLIVERGWGVAGTDLHLGVDPDLTPAESGSLHTFLTEGDEMPHETMGLPVAAEASTIQVVVRGLPDDYLTPRGRALDLRYFLLSQGEQTRRGVRLLGLVPIGGVLPLGRDGHQRDRFSLNFTAVWEAARATA